MTPLRPAESYTTELEFSVPKDASGLRLLLNTTPAWPDHLVIGDENSWGHKKTYFALGPAGRNPNLLFALNAALKRRSSMQY